MKLIGKILVVSVSLLMSSSAWAGADVTEEMIAKYAAKADQKNRAKKANKAVEKVKETVDLIESRGVKIGDFDENVLNIQERLAVIGYYPTYLVDGVYSKAMKKVIKRFQKDYGLKADGIFGPKTATALNYYTGTQHIVPVSHYKTVYYLQLPGYYAN